MIFDLYYYCWAPQNNTKYPYLGPFLDHFSFLLENLLEFSMKSTLIVFSMNHPKNLDVLISERREKVKQDAKMSFLCPYYVFNYSLF